MLQLQQPRLSLAVFSRLNECEGQRETLNSQPVLLRIWHTVHLETMH